MSNVFFYEPFYDIDRLVDDAFNAPTPTRRGTNEMQLQRKGGNHPDGAIRGLKPRYA